MVQQQLSNHGAESRSILVLVQMRDQAPVCFLFTFGARSVLENR
eukprot:COSAG02_NODE_16218_length_1102_cov_13.394816_1_plen_43_part_10